MSLSVLLEALLLVASTVIAPTTIVTASSVVISSSIVVSAAAITALPGIIGASGLGLPGLIRGGFGRAPAEDAFNRHDARIGIVERWLHAVGWWRRRRFPTVPLMIGVGATPSARRPIVGRIPPWQVSARRRWSPARIRPDRLDVLGHVFTKVKTGIEGLARLNDQGA